MSANVCHLRGGALPEWAEGCDQMFCCKTETSWPERLWESVLPLELQDEWSLSDKRREKPFTDRRRGVESCSVYKEGGPLIASLLSYAQSEGRCHSWVVHPSWTLELKTRVEGSGTRRKKPASFSHWGVIITAEPTQNQKEPPKLFHPHWFGVFCPSWVNLIQIPHISFSAFHLPGTP